MSIKLWNAETQTADNLIGSQIENNIIDDTTASTDKVYSSSKVEDIIKEVYSTEEVKTNKVWIDGKPIYRLVYFSAENPFNLVNEYVIGQAFKKDVPVSFDSYKIDTLVCIDAYLRRSQWTNKLPLWDSPFSVELGTFRNKYHTVSNTVIVRANIDEDSSVIPAQVANWDTGNFEIVLEYTKTTD